jgi:hypothetical protein
MSALSFSFRPEAIPAYAQAEFLSRFFQLVLDYQTLTEPVPVPVAPPAESLPQPDFAAKPSAFHPVDGDEAEKPKKERKNPWVGLTEEQLSDFGVTWGVGAFILFMLFIIGEIAWKSKAGKTGTFVLFFVLAFGMLGFIAKSVIQNLWGI